MKNKTIKYDMIFFIILIIIIGSAFMLKKNNEGTLVKITSYQKEYGIYDLSENKTININNENIIEIKNGEVFMKKATCPDHTCMKQGHISQSGSSIICLPHQLIIEISGKENNFDGQVY